MIQVAKKTTHLLIKSQPGGKPFDVGVSQSEIPYLSDTNGPGNQVKQLLPSGLALQGIYTWCYSHVYRGLGTSMEGNNRATFLPP